MLEIMHSIVNSMCTSDVSSIVGEIFEMELSTHNFPTKYFTCPPDTNQILHTTSEGTTCDKNGEKYKNSPSPSLLELHHVRVLQMAQMSNVGVAQLVHLLHGDRLPVA